VIADDLGWNDLGYHGSEIPTPAIDSLAKAGVRLERMYAQPMCSPTRSSLMTGRYPMRFGLQHLVVVQSQPVGVPKSELLLSEKLKSLKYSTHLVGKWHLGFYQPQYLPTARGFDTHFGVYSADIDYYVHGLGRQNFCNPLYTNTQCPICFFGYDLRSNDKKVATQKGNNGTYATYLWNKKAVNRIKKYRKEQGPLFLYLAPNNPHTPLESSADPYFVEKYCSHITNDTRRTYCGSVVALDSLVQNVTNALKAKNMWKDTVFIFTSDNGGEVYDRTFDPILNNARYSHGNNWPLRGVKQTVWEGGVRVPAFVYSELLRPEVRGTENNGLMHVSDWFPTIVQGILGATTTDSQPLDGLNMWPSISQGTPSPRTEVLINTDAMDFNSGALIKGQWKLVVGNFTRDLQIYATDPYVPLPGQTITSPCQNPVNDYDDNFRLYNIFEDPSECVNIADQNPVVLLSMIKRYFELVGEAQFPTYPLSDPNANPDFYGGYWSPWESDDGTPLNPNPISLFPISVQDLITNAQEANAPNTNGYCPNEPGVGYVVVG